MRIEWLTVCRGFDKDGDGFPNLYGVLIDTSYVQRLDEEIAITVALVLAETWVNINRGVVSYPLQATVHDPEMNVLLSGELPVRAYIDPATFPEGGEGRVVVTVTLAFTPTSEGIYQLGFSLEGAVPSTLAHYVEIDPLGRGVE